MEGLNWTKYTLFSFVTSFDEGSSLSSICCHGWMGKCQCQHLHVFGRGSHRGWRTFLASILVNSSTPDGASTLVSIFKYFNLHCNKLLLSSLSCEKIWLTISSQWYSGQFKLVRTLSWNILSHPTRNSMVGNGTAFDSRLLRANFVFLSSNLLLLFKCSHPEAQNYFFYLASCPYIHTL